MATKRTPVWAVIPVKPFAEAKRRLAGVLPEAARRDLARAMFADVLAAVTATPGLAGVVVVTREGEAAALARAAGALALHEDAAEGQSAAVGRAAAALEGQNATLLTVPGDLPLLAAEDVGTLLAAHGDACGLTMVPARDGDGTNAMVLAPPRALPFRFGAGSFHRHLDEARRAGLPVRVLELARVGLDIDTPADLAELARRGARGRTATVLARAAIADRLGARVPVPAAREARA